MDLQKFYNERKKDLLIKKGQSRDYVSESDVVALLEELQKQLSISHVVGQSEQLQPKQDCYKSGKLCEYNCSGLCKESC